MVLRTLAVNVARDDALCKHVLADVPGFDDLARRASSEARVLQGRTDEFGVDPLEVDRGACRILLDAEWSNDECARRPKVASLFAAGQATVPDAAPPEVGD
jgi:hypothetical protein